MRLFIAIDLSEQQRKEVRALQQRLQGYLQGVKRIRPESLHLTLKFLGEVEPGRVPEIAAAMAEAASGTGPFTIRFGSCGVFPGIRNARVLWAGLQEGSRQVETTAAALEASLVNKGFTAGEYRFTAHLTLARARQRLPVEKVKRFLAEEQAFSTAPAEIRGFTLYRSSLSPGGALYSTLQEILFT